ncbi:uncharacterized protein LOC134724466 [Mytilus trossulus]|uniref:uncharacterized protein LOC134724466 n=1 Tax=Mytilus trossulus TaxID=6551 RepID=UPI003006AB04
MLLLLSMTTVLLSVAAQHNLTPYGNATQSSSYLTAPVNAIHPPIANTFSFPYCSLSNIQTTAAWWMFQFSFGTAYITDIAIYYRENYAHRMDGFKLYVTNTSTIPPDVIFAMRILIQVCQTSHKLFLVTNLENMSSISMIKDHNTMDL